MVKAMTEILKIKAPNGSILNVGDLINYEGDFFRLNSITFEREKACLWVYPAEESGKLLGNELLLIHPGEPTKGGKE